MVKKIELDWDYAFPVMKFLKVTFKVFLFNFQFRFGFLFGSIFGKVEHDSYVKRPKVKSLQTTIDANREKITAKLVQKDCEN